MKTKINTISTKVLTALLVLMAFVISANAQINYGTNTITGTNASAIGDNNTASGNSSFVGGIDSEALGKYSLAFGDSAKVWSRNGIALGKQVSVFGAYSFGAGENVKTTTTSSMVIGIGYNDYHPLVNGTSRSLMIGFHSDKPTLFVSPSTGLGHTGKIGIGNVTDPQAKLHIKADNGENADLMLDPGGSSYLSIIKFGETSTNVSPNRIEAQPAGDLNFRTGSDFVFNEANIGIGTDNPRAKLHIADGDVFIEDINSGIIMKSPNGQCWRGKIDNSGSLVFEAIDCELLTKTDKHGSTPNLQVNIFPNPTSSNITIEVSGNHNPLTVRFFNMEGSLALSMPMKSSNLEIKTEKLPTGNYIVKVSTERGNIIHTEKIVVL
ncbi:MAG: T9SS type A sorting domain-containing protein [Chlorobi bacterium]|nr:T9SS type A sorting domain-containing protein [Chlorobiota bacterium]